MSLIFFEFIGKLQKISFPISSILNISSIIVPHCGTFEECFNKANFDFGKFEVKNKSAEYQVGFRCMRLR